MSEDEDYMDLSSWSGKSGKAVRNVRSKIHKDGRAYSGKSDKDDRDYSGKSDKDDRDSRDKGGKSDKSDFFYDEEASEDEDFILTDSGKHHHWGKGTRDVVIGSKSGHRVVWPKSDKVASEDEGEGYDSVGDV